MVHSVSPVNPLPSVITSIETSSTEQMFGDGGIFGGLLLGFEDGMLDGISEGSLEILGEDDGVLEGKFVG